MSLSGPFDGPQALAAGDSSAREVKVEDLRSWSDSTIIPAIDSDLMLKAYLQMQKHAGFSSDRHPWRARSYNEVHATHDKALWSSNTDEYVDRIKVYKGSSFGIWEPDSGDYYALASRSETLTRLMEKRANQVRGDRGAFGGMPMSWANDPDTLPIMGPRIAWRMVARSTDSRTFIASVLPPDVLVTHHSYCVFFREAEVGDDAFLLGVFSSIAFDWLARRVVEINLTGELVAALPVPVADRSNPLRRRIAALAGQLVPPLESLREWRERSINMDPAVTSMARVDAEYELDACVFLLYGLDANESSEVMRTCHPKLAERAEGVLAAISRLEN